MKSELNRGQLFRGKPFSKIKVALVHDWLFNLRGAERQLKYISEIFPEADIYCLGYNDSLIKKEFPHFKGQVYASFLNKLYSIEKLYTYFFPFTLPAVEQFSFSEYDLVISTSYLAAKGVITNLDTFHISYMFTPTRNLWEQFSFYGGAMSYDAYTVKFLHNLCLPYLRTWDNHAARRPDKIVSISDYISRLVQKHYKRESEVLYPAVEVNTTLRSFQKQDYYLHVTSFESYKNTGFLVDAFNEIGERLLIIGSKNRNAASLLQRANPNIEFLGWVSEEEKIKLISEAKAVIVPGIEDFGMLSIESQSLDTPVIGYSKGGNKETIPKNFLFEQKTVKSIKEKLKEIDNFTISAAERSLLKEKFGVKRFKESFRRLVKQYYEDRN